MGWLARLQPVAAAVLLAACVTAPEAPPPAPPPPEPVHEPVSSVEPIVPPAPRPPAPKPAKPKPVKKVEKPADTATIRAADSAADTTATPPPKPEPQIKGPAWLSRCAAKHLEGVVILCDSDTLIVQPSLNVKVYTREPALAGKTGDGAEIKLRSGLPMRYRIFVVP